MHDDDNNKEFSFLSCLHAHFESSTSFLPSLAFSFHQHRLSRKNIFHPREHAISESFSLHDDVEVFPFFLSLFRREKIINGRKLRKLCNIFIKFFAVACNFSEKGKVFLLCDVAYGKEEEEEEWKLKLRKFSLHGEGEKVYEA